MAHYNKGWRNNPTDPSGRRHGLSARGIKNAPSKTTAMKKINQLSLPQNRIHISQVIRANERAGKTWFEKGNVRFFKSKWQDTAYLAPGSTTKGFFISNETNPSEEKRYTIRKFDLATGEVNTFGKFHAFPDLKTAKSKLDIILKRAPDGKPSREEIAQWFEKRFGRKPEYDKTYFNEWVGRFDSPRKVWTFSDEQSRIQLKKDFPEAFDLINIEDEVNNQRFKTPYYREILDNWKNISK